MTRPSKAVYITEVTIQDPDSGTRVTIGIFKDPLSKGLFGVERLFLEQIDRDVQSPYNECRKLTCAQTMRR